LSDFHAAESGQGTTSKASQKKTRTKAAIVRNGKGTSLLLPLSRKWWAL